MANSLHDAGELISLQKSEAAQIVVLDPTWLCSSVVGQILAPEQLHRERDRRRPLVNVSDLEAITDCAAHFGAGGGRTLAVLLRELGLCFQVAVSERAAEGYLYFFPALRKEEVRPTDLFLSNPRHRAGRRLLARSEADALVPGFFLQLQVRAAQQVAFRADTAFEQKLWVDGVLLQRGPSQAIVEKSRLADGRDAVDILACSAGSEAQLWSQLAAAEDLALTVLESTCPGTRLDTYAISEPGLDHAVAPAARQGHAKLLSELEAERRSGEAHTIIGGQGYELDALLGPSDLAAGDGGAAALREVLEPIAAELGGFSHASLAKAQLGGVDSRFNAPVEALVFGAPVDAARGIEHYMRVDASTVRSGLNQGVAAVRREFETAGTEEDNMCLRYVLDEEAGTNRTPFQENLCLDCDAEGSLLECRRRADGRGMRLADFCSHPKATASALTEAHVAALRVYSTAAYRSLNNPLRVAREDRPPHGFPVTIALIHDAVKKLRAASAQADDAHAELDLWRGMQNRELPDGFMRMGGTEVAPMSTTSDLSTAVKYSVSRHAILLRLRTHDFIMRGADISFLSAFPAEAEYLFPPLTYCRPTGHTTVLTIDDATFKVVDVVPDMQ